MLDLDSLDIKKRRKNKRKRRMERAYQICKLSNLMSVDGEPLHRTWVERRVTFAG